MCGATKPFVLSPKGRFSTGWGENQGPSLTTWGGRSVTCHIWPDFPEQRYTSINNIDDSVIKS